LKENNKNTNISLSDNYKDILFTPSNIKKTMNYLKIYSNSFSKKIFSSLKKEENIIIISEKKISNDNNKLSNCFPNQELKLFNNNQIFLSNKK
jgi:hypothetical protein